MTAAYFQRIRRLIPDFGHRKPRSPVVLWTGHTVSPSPLVLCASHHQGETDKRQVNISHALSQIIPHVGLGFS